MTVKNPTPARLFVLLARSAPVGVILRRGPSDWVQLIKWRMDKDSFEPGQWFKGRIYERRCDLSPDGLLFIYFAHKGSNWARNPSYTHAWTAISKPPYFTALALWPKGTTYEGGGLFETEKKVWVNHCYNVEPHPAHQPARYLKVRHNETPNVGEHKIYIRRLQRDGWQMVEAEPDYVISTFDGRKYSLNVPPASIMSKQVGMYTLTLYVGLHWLDAGQGIYEYLLTHNPTKHEAALDAATWADFDQQGRVLVAAHGKLFSAVMDDSGQLTLTELADFNANTPESVSAPAWARRW
jgi:hypothetical protein